MNKQLLPPISLRSSSILKAALVLLGLFVSFVSFGQNITITTPTVWTTNHTASRIVILPGGSLTITSGATLTMNSANTYDGIRVYSYPFTNTGSPNIAGGRLIVDNATITGSNWNAICVLGNVEPNDPFYAGPPSSLWAPISQGDVRMASAIFQNSAVIEGSHFGVLNYDIQSGNPATTSGGIIQATNTTFRDNYYSVRMVHYRNFIKRNNSIAYLSDRSFFITCLFRYNLSSSSNHTFMYLHEVNGINILGNEFYVWYPTTPFIGILLDNAGANIAEYCTSPSIQQGVPCPNSIQNFFHNIQTAIATNSLSQNGSYRLNISGNEFGLCRTSISLSGTSQTSIINNGFDIFPDFRTPRTGVFLGGCTGYKVEGNKVNVAMPSFNGKIWGIAAKNSGSNPNTIYRNEINNTNYALQGIDWNKDLNGSFSGLQFLCNTMTADPAVATGFDIVVAKSTPTTVAGIATLQNNNINSSLANAENNFSNLDNSTNPHNYANNGQSIIYVGSIPAGGIYRRKHKHY